MFYAINSKTKRRVDSVSLEIDGSYQFIYEDIWYADPLEIASYNKEKIKDISKIKVKYRKGSTKINENGTKFEVLPHFFIPNKSELGINTIPESKEHKMAKLLIYSLAKTNKLEFFYSKAKDWDNSININELDIDWDKTRYEESISDGKTQKADIIIQFKKRDAFFGNGVVIEIQFSRQYETTTEKRTIDWAMKGYSICWLWEYDFVSFTSEKMEVKPNSMKLHIYTKIIKRWKEQIERDVKWMVQDLCQQIDNKLIEIDNKFKLFNNPKILGECKKCNIGYMMKKRGKYGEFYGCSNFPNCKHIVKLK